MANEFKIKKGLIVTGASGGTVVDIQGSQGQLFSVTDNLSGSIFAVSDISGVPIFDVNSSGLSTFDGNVNLGANHIGRDDDNYIGFQTDNLIKFRVAGATQVKIGDGVFSAQTNNDVDLGSSGARFKDIYLSGKVVAGTGSTAAATINAYSTAVSTGLYSALRVIEHGTASSYWDIGATNAANTLLNFYHNGSTTPKIIFTHTGGADFVGKATSAQTAAADSSITLTTKSYVDGLVTGVPVYKGTWDARNNSERGSGSDGGSPDLRLNANKVLGNYYIVDTAGSATPNGAGTEPSSWNVGDWCIFSDITPGVGTDLWQKIDNTSVISGAGTGQKVTKWEGAGPSETLTDGPITFSGNNSTFTGDITSAGLTVDYTGNRTGDAGILVTNDASDWGIKVDKDGTADYGILSQTDGENAIVVRNAAGVDKIQLQGDGDASFAGDVTVGTGVIKTSIGGDIAITQGAIGLRINDTASSITPTTATLNNDNTVNLGTNNIRWKNLYLGGDINLAAGKKLQYSANSFMTPENNVSGAEISTAGTFIVKTGTTPTLGLTLNASQNAIFAGNVTTGANITATGDTGNSTLTLQANTGNWTFTNVQASRNLEISDSDGTGTVMTINTSGNVGIGTTSPASKLHIDSNSNSTYPSGFRDGELRIANDNSSNVANQTSSIVLSATGWAGSSTGVAQLSVIQDGSNISNGTFTIKVRDNGTHSEAFRIKYNGNVGIGTTSPGTFLQLGTYNVAGKYINQATYPDIPSEHMMHITAPSTNAYYGGGISFGETAFTAANIVVRDAGGSGALDLCFGTGTAAGVTEKMRIANSGKVSVGSPIAGQLGVRGTTNDSTAYSFEAANSSGNTLFIVRNDGEVWMPSGNVGIGTTTVQNKLVVRGSGSAFNSTLQNSTASIISKELTDNAYHSILQLVAVRQSLTTGKDSQGYLGFSTVDDSNNQGQLDAGRIAIVNETGSSRNSATALTFWTNPGGTQTTAAVEKMRISSGGLVKFNAYGAGTLVTDASGNITVSSGGGAGGPYLPLSAGSSYPLTDNLYINNVDQNNSDRYGNFRSEVVFTRSPVTGNPNQWFKVVELGGSPKRIKFSIISSGDNTNSYDNFLISTSGYGMYMHIEKLPGGKYNTSKLLSVAAVNPNNGGSVEIWIKLGPVSSGTGATYVACTSDVLASATILASATTTAPTITANDTQLDISNDNRLYATLQASRGATFGAKVGIGTNAPAAMLTVAGGDATISGNVGIGTTSTGVPLQVNVTGNNTVFKYTRDTGTNGALTLGFDGALSNFNSEQGGYVFNTQGNERMRIDSSGNVGILTTSMLNTGSNRGSLTIGGSTAGTINIGNGSINFGIYATAAESNTYSLGVMKFSVGSGFPEKMRITSTGNVGIGVTGPIVPLHVSGTAVNNPSNGSGGYEVMQIFDTTSYATGVGGGIGFGGNFTSSNNTIFSEIRGLKENATDSNYAGALSFSTRLNGGSITERMRIDSAGNVGIGTTNPLAKLDIQGTQGQLFSVTDDLSGSIFAVADISGVPIFDVNSSGVSYFDGSVGIGVTDPEKKLEVKSDTTYDGIMLDVLSNPEITFRDRGNSDTRVGTGRHGLDGFHIDTYSGNAFFIKGSNRYVGIGTTSPGNKLHVVEGTGTWEAVEIESSSTTGCGVTLVGANTNVQWSMIANASNGGAGANNLGFHLTGAGSSGGSAGYKMIIQASSGNVGIGTTAPTEGKLVVVGKTALKAASVSEVALRIQRSSSTGRSQYTLETESGSEIWRCGMTGAGSTDYGFFDGVQNAITIKYRDDVLFTPAGNVGIGTTSPGAKLDVAGSINTSGSINLTNAGVNTIAASNASNGYLRFLVDQQGVALTLNADTTSTFGGIIYAVDGNKATPGYSFASDPDTGMFRDSANVLVLGVNGDTRIRMSNTSVVTYKPLGINTTSITSGVALDVGGVGLIGDSGVGDLYLGNYATANHFRFHTNNSNTYFDMNCGDIYWRQGTSTRYQFFASTANMTIQGTLTQNSDARTKENVVEISDCISKVKAMRGVYYNRTDFNTDVTKVGVIAQEVEAVLPELVLESPETGLKSVAYSELTSVLINAIKEQQEIIEDLKTRITKLEN